MKGDTSMFVLNTTKNNYVNHHEYVCDTRDDIQSLPTTKSTPYKCGFGSTAFVIEDSSVWMLNSDGEWKEI